MKLLPNYYKHKFEKLFGEYLIVKLVNNVLLNNRIYVLNRIT